MKKLETGDVFTFNCSDTKYVYYGRTFEEWYNTGGMGKYTYYYIKLDVLLRLGDIKDTEELKQHMEEDKNQRFEDCVEIDTSEPPFEITSRQTTLYSVRRKKSKTITIYE